MKKQTLVEYSAAGEAVNNAPDREVDISIVIPVLNEGEVLGKMLDGLFEAVRDEKVRYEFVIVDDGSTDGTWKRIVEESGKSSMVKGVRLSRNFGHDAALFSGIRRASGKALITMDCDGQHPFSEISAIVKIWQELDCDIVNCVKAERGAEGRFYSTGAGFFGSILSWTMKRDLKNATEFKLLSRRAATALLACGDYHYFYRALVPWIGLIQVDHRFAVAPSMRKTSHWNFFSLTRFAISGLIMFSDAPIRLIFFFGACVLLICLVLFAKLLYVYSTGEITQGYSTLLTLQLMSLGLMMVCMGILGMYVRMVLNQALRRPRAIISEFADGARREKVMEFL